MSRPDARMQAVLGMIDAASAPLADEDRLEFLEDLSAAVGYRVDRLANELGIEPQEGEYEDEEPDEPDEAED